MKKLQALFAISALSLLTACSSTPDRNSGGSAGSDKEVTQDTAPGIGEDGQGVEVISADGKGGSNGQDIGSGANIDNMSMVDVNSIYEPVVYFAYDQYELDEEGTKNVRYHSDILTTNPSMQVTLNGHTDERGTPEYNLALGEKRAKAVAQAMMLFGVEERRIEVVSFGEEQPEVAESSEAAWQKNRRVEIIIK